jgi:GntR family transcriptional regulator
VSAYRQWIDQVRHAFRLGLLPPGDQLPTVRHVVRQVAINPNTVHRAYRDLEGKGLTEGRPGSGTFRRSLSEVPDNQALQLSRLEEWIRAVRAAGFGDESISTLAAEAMKTPWLVTGKRGIAMTTALVTEGLGRRYRTRRGPRDGTLRVSTGSIT